MGCGRRTAYWVGLSELVSNKLNKSLKAAKGFRLFAAFFSSEKERLKDKIIGTMLRAYRAFMRFARWIPIIGLFRLSIG